MFYGGNTKPVIDIAPGDSNVGFALKLRGCALESVVSSHQPRVHLAPSRWRSMAEARQPTCCCAGRSSTAAFAVARRASMTINPAVPVRLWLP